tara:strand:+ start:176 stop:490 length:315 start_codon:yes stop_codon:yes gene_type:complete
MKNRDGKRMVAYNAHMTDVVGVIWCEVEEDTAGYRPMTGSHPLQAPWYLAYFENHTGEDGKVDYTALWKNAEATVDSWNKDNGLTRKEAMDIVASSMRASRMVA